MQIYKLLITKTKHGYLVKQPEFDFAIDADTLEHAIMSAKNQIEQMGALMMKNGEPIPEEAAAELNLEFLPYTSIVYVQVDIEKKFRDSATESVRKNISMPAWMDIQLRYHGVDASKLFQDAAIAYLEKKTGDKEPCCKKISNVEELVENVNEEVLKQYVMNHIQRILA